MSVGNEFIELELDKSPATLIVGVNGAGKSSAITDTIFYALFSRPFRDIKKLSLINSITKKGLLVELDFDINGVPYMVRRGMKPNIFEVFCRDEMINQDADARDYQDIFEKNILRVTHKSFRQIVVLGSASFVPFMQLPGGQRREIIEDLLDLQIFTSMNIVVKKKISENEAFSTELESSKRVLNERLRLMRKHAEELRNSNEQVIIDTQTLIQDQNSEISALEARKAELEQLLIDDENVKSSEKALSTKIQDIGNLRAKIEQKRERIKREVNFFHDNDECPTCKQNIDTEFKCEAVEERLGQTDELETALTKLQNQYDQLNKDLNDIIKRKNDLINVKIDINSINTKISSALDYIDELEKKIKALRKKNKEVDTSELANVADELKETVAHLTQLAEDRDTLSIFLGMIKDGGIKSQIIRQYIPIMNKLINKYLTEMDCFFGFELDDNFQETIKSRYRDDFSYSSFSEGEKARINLAILFAWRAIAKMRNSINTNLLVFDETMDGSLDNAGTEHFFKIVQQLASDSNIFIISHKENMIDKFDNVLRFNKVKNFTVLEGRDAA